MCAFYVGTELYCMFVCLVVYRFVFAWGFYLFFIFCICFNFFAFLLFLW